MLLTRCRNDLDLIASIWKKSSAYQISMILNKRYEYNNNDSVVVSTTHHHIFDSNDVNG